MLYKIVKLSTYGSLVSCHATFNRETVYKVGETTYSHIPRTYLFTFDTLENARKHFKQVGFGETYRIYECEVEGVSNNRSFLDSAVIIPEGTVLSYGVKLTKLAVLPQLYKHGTKMKYRDEDLMLCLVEIGLMYYQIINLKNGNRWSDRYVTREYGGSNSSGINQEQLHYLLNYNPAFPLILENEQNLS